MCRMFTEGHTSPGYCLFHQLYSPLDLFLNRAGIVLEQCLLGHEFEEGRQRLIRRPLDTISIAEYRRNIGSTLASQPERLAQGKYVDPEAQNAAFRSINESDVRASAKLSRKVIPVRDHGFSRVHELAP